MFPDRRFPPGQVYRNLDGTYFVSFRWYADRGLIPFLPDFGNQPQSRRDQYVVEVSHRLRRLTLD